MVVVLKPVNCIGILHTGAYILQSVLNGPVGGIDVIGPLTQGFEKSSRMNV